MLEGKPDKPDCIFLYGPRACGKTTVAKTLSELLPGWCHVDIDTEFERRRYLKAQREAFDYSSYYTDSVAILEEFTKGSKVIIALGGGALANGVSTDSGLRTLGACVKRGPLVLVLPSRFDFLCRRILFKRERGRDYFLDRKTFDRHYEERMPQLRQYADLTVFGEDPVQLGRQIIKSFSLAATPFAVEKKAAVVMTFTDNYQG